MDLEVTGAGRAFAYSYYSGYAKFLLATPSKGQSFVQRIVKFEQDHNITIAAKQLLIIVPTFPLFLSDFESFSSGRIQQIAALDRVSVSRAGMKNRLYSANVYSLKNQNSEDPVHVVMDLPAILMTLFEMCELRNGATKEQQTETLSQNDPLQEEVSAFLKTLTNLLEADPLCKNSYKLISYTGKDDKGQHIEMVDFIRAQFIT